jgi:hypothetical protein
MYGEWWNCVFVWWCLVLWPCLSWFLEVSVGVLWILYLQWHHLPSWVSLTYLPHPCHLSLFLLTRGHHKKEAEGRYNLKKRRPHSTFLPTLCLLLSHLTLMKTTLTKKDEYWRSYTQTTKEDSWLPTSIAILFISLLLVSSFFESRDEISFKGGRFVTSWNFQFQDVNREND